jgi:putative ABC transport system substrate-binding protein
MKRRELLFALVSLPVTVRAQPSKTWVVGLLDAGDRIEWWATFREEMRKLGYVEGKNLTLEPRYARGNQDALPKLADELVRRKVDLIVTSGTVAAIAAKNATGKTPIVMATGTDPLSLGIAKSLSRPGENVTGLTSLSSELTGKRFALMREMFPGMSRVGILWHRENPASAASVRDLLAVAGNAKVAVRNLPVTGGEGLGDAFQAAIQEHAQALMVVQGPLIYRERKKIAELAVKHKLPTMNGAAEYVDAGGLVSYAPSYPEFFRRAAIYADRILKGAHAGDLPIEQPTTFELVINQKTAAALGLTIPQAVVLRADRVISAL